MASEADSEQLEPVVDVGDLGEVGEVGEQHDGLAPLGAETTERLVVGPVVLHRVMDITVGGSAERAQADAAVSKVETAIAADDLIPIAISSDTRKVERFDRYTGQRFVEVLDHSADGIDMSFARDGLPFLMNHDGDTQIGIVERVQLGKDGKLRGFVRMGNHPDAAWVRKDMLEGIRRKVSVGYQPSEKYEVLSKRGEEPEVRLYRGWRPYEVSSVPVPADYDVGVARSAFEGSNAPASPRGLPDTSRTAAKEKQMEEGKQEVPAAAGGIAAVTRDYEAERKQRNKELGQLANIATSGGMDGNQMLGEALQKDWTPAQFAEHIHQESAARAARGVPAGRVPMSDKEQKEYSVVRAMREVAQSKLEGRAIKNSIEFEVSQQIAADLKRDPKGIFIPLGLTSNRDAADEYRERAGLSRAAVTGAVVGTTSLGGVGVQTNVTSMIELLRNSLVTKRAGIRTMDGLQGNVLFPRQTAANSWTWEGENPSTAKADSAGTFDSFTLSPKTGYGATAYSKQLLIQASFSVEQWVREDLAQIAAIGIDLAVLHGLGSSNQPTGIFVLSGTSSVLFATDGAAPTWAKIVEFETTMNVNNALQGNCAYISSPGIKGYLKTNLKNTVAGANYLLDAGGMLNDYPAYFTNQVRTNFTAGTSTTICHGVVFGNWSEGILASWGDALDVTVDPYKYLDQGMIRVVESAMVDVGFRHPKSFVVATSAKTS
jgi:HK97 family phage major capsid protein